MSKKTITYTRQEKRAEKEIDAFLYRINNEGGGSVLDELRALAD